MDGLAPPVFTTLLCFGYGRSDLLNGRQPATTMRNWRLEAGGWRLELGLSDKTRDGERGTYPPLGVMKEGTLSPAASAKVGRLQPAGALTAAPETIGEDSQEIYHQQKRPPKKHCYL
ncbi:uncharacterized protein BDZ83DRAFT_730662 [Colletotrichum acutatum]|uniref:Uncharacterized protein n=1 Tax=Glomerella acutata TaxID=27357 RepID=A0AAD8XER4_GLOAC|nr:uncharacterized protein BDZ83DRAFT_730662 [Colletotrichum acutatum]KAK1725054.1 hypothetical protein BDZ83DRAFT_730662 [Colletotrichum acutatum]